MDKLCQGRKRYIFFYINREEPEKVRRVVSAHVAYWKTINPIGYKGGPLGDLTGGLITFLAAEMDEAETIVLDDPFVKEGLIAQQWIKEWIIGEEFC